MFTNCAQVRLQHHQIMRYAKITLMIDVITMRRTPGITPRPHQILRLPCKIALRKKQRNFPPKTVETSSQMRDRAEPDPKNDQTMNSACRTRPLQNWTRPLEELFFPIGNAFCIENYNISRSGCLSRFHRSLGLPQKSDTRRSPNAALATKRDTPRSATVVPFTKNESYHWPLWHITQLHCAEQQVSSTSIIKYCAFHQKIASFILVRFGGAFCFEDCNISRSGNLPRFHRMLCLPKSDTPTSPNAAPATKSDTPPSPNAAPSTKTDTPTSENIFVCDELGHETWMHYFFAVALFTARFL